MASTLGTVQPFRYRGYVYDEENLLYYLASRYYSLDKQRFINADTILIDNLFSYCGNAPVRRHDAMGMAAADCYDEDNLPGNDNLTCLGPSPLGYPIPSLYRSSGTGGRPTSRSQIRISAQDIYQKGPHYRKHGTVMGFTSSDEYNDAAHTFANAQINNPESTIVTGYLNPRSGQASDLQVAISYGGYSVVIRYATGQIMDFYLGSTHSALIHQRIMD